MYVVGFGFLKADAANEVCVGDFAACKYLIFPNGKKIVDVCYALIGDAFFQ